MTDAGANPGKATTASLAARLRPGRWLALLLAAFLIALVMRAPLPTWLSAAEHLGMLPADLEWEQARGSLRQGSLAGLRGEPGELGQLHWTLRPGALLRARLAADLTWEPETGGQVRGRVSAGPTGAVTLTSVTGTLPASALNHMDSGIPLLLDGQLQARDVTLGLDRQRNVRDAGGTILWQEAAAGLPRPLPLGEQRATLDREGERLAIHLASAPGAPLGAEGRLFLDLVQEPPGIEARIAMEAGEDADEGLEVFLQQQLEPDAQGRYLWTTQPDS